MRVVALNCLLRKVEAASGGPLCRLQIPFLLFTLRLSPSLAPPLPACAFLLGLFPQPPPCTVPQLCNKGRAHRPSVKTESPFPDHPGRVCVTFRNVED